MGISSKEKRLIGLHQNQNFGQAALKYYLAEALSNLAEFGSEQTEIWVDISTHRRGLNEIVSCWRIYFSVVTLL